MVCNNRLILFIAVWVAVCNRYSVCCDSIISASACASAFPSWFLVIYSISLFVVSWVLVSSFIVLYVLSTSSSIFLILSIIFFAHALGACFICWLAGFLFYLFFVELIRGLVLLDEGCRIDVPGFGLGYQGFVINHKRCFARFSDFSL